MVLFLWIRFLFLLGLKCLLSQQPVSWPPPRIPALLYKAATQYFYRDAPHRLEQFRSSVIHALKVWNFGNHTGNPCSVGSDTGGLFRAPWDEKCQSTLELQPSTHFLQHRGQKCFYSAPKSLLLRPPKLWQFTPKCCVISYGHSGAGAACACSRATPGRNLAMKQKCLLAVNVRT